MLKRLAFLLFLFPVFAPARAAERVELTTNLIKAEPGSWIRRYLPNGHSWTLYVADNDNGEVTIDYFRHHDGHIVGRKTDTVTHEWLEKQAVNPDSPDAKPGSLSRKDVAYQVKIVERALENSPGVYYISDAVPATGVIRLDIISQSGNVNTLWTDEYGSEPDELLRRTLEK